MDAITPLQRRMLRAMRAARISPAELARQVGVSRAAVSGWLHIDEDKRRHPSDEHLIKLASALGVTLGWLRTGMGDGPTEADVAPWLTATRHAQKDVWLRTLVEEVRKQRADLAQFFGKTVGYPGLRALRFVYASGALLLEVQYLEGNRPVSLVYPSLWALAVTHVMDQRAAVSRHPVLAVAFDRREAPPWFETASREAEVLGIEVLVVHSPEELARYIVRYQSVVW
jgi:HTH-type transcriptional regulator, cell division transcriptional repressor